MSLQHFVAGAVARERLEDGVEDGVQDTRERMRRFVVENFYVADPSELADDTSLIDSGLVDSTGMLEVIAFLESEFAIRVRDQEMVPANLETIGRIVDFVARKRAAARPA
jgi:acyl carrier protein